MTFKTPNELRLEIENASLRRRLYQYEPHYQTYDAVKALPTDDVPVVNMPAIMPVYQLAQWRADIDGGVDAVRVVGRTVPPPGGLPFQVAYYVSKAELLTTRDRLNLLGVLHERVIRQLAEVRV